jgi:hypothetical protein
MLRPRMQRLLEEPAYRLKVGRGEGRAAKARPTGKVLGKAGDVMARWRRDWWKVEGKRPTASPKQPAFLKLRAMGTDAVRRGATGSGSCRTSQWSDAWIVRDVRMAQIVRIME